MGMCPLGVVEMVVVNAVQVYFGLCCIYEPVGAYNKWLHKKSWAVPCMIYSIGQKEK
jgi:hypothetical protein